MSPPTFPVQVEYEFTPELAALVISAHLRKMRRTWIVSLVSTALLYAVIILVMRAHPHADYFSFRLGIALGVCGAITLLVLLSYFSLRKKLPAAFLGAGPSAGKLLVDREAMTFTRGASSSRYAIREIGHIERHREFWMFSPVHQTLVQYYLPSQLLSPEVRRYIEETVESAGGKVTGNE